MKDKVWSIVDRLVRSSDSKLALKTLEKLFNRGIPFNAPHKFKFLELSNTKTVVECPDISRNRNHLGGIHACAIATLGEYPAGLTLIKSFGVSSYRVIMRRLQVEYFKQSRSSIRGEVLVDQELMEKISQQLKNEEQADIDMVTNILDINNEVIAVVKTNWQLKNWHKVSFKN